MILTVLPPTPSFEANFAPRLPLHDGVDGIECAQQIVDLDLDTAIRGKVRTIEAVHRERAFTARNKDFIARIAESGVSSSVIEP